jgi:hypothetical protein
MAPIRLSFCLTFLLVSFSSVQVFGQLPSVVQLPSFQTFSYSGSVVVPDAGTTSLGGVKSSAYYSQRRPGFRSTGWSQSNSQAAVTATIIDLHEMDRQLLGASPEVIAEEIARGDRGVRSKPADPVEEGKALVRYARRQLREGKKAEAFVTYQMAIAVLDGRLRDLALVEYRNTFGPAAEQALELSRPVR